MKKIVFLMILCMSGCDPPERELPPLPPPEVQVTIHEDTETVWSEINVSYHGQSGAAPFDPMTLWANIKLNNLEEVQNYRKQAEFLLLRLTEIEEKMQSKQPKEGEGNE